MATVLATAVAARADRISTPKGIAHNGQMEGVAADGLIMLTTNDIKRTISLADIQRIRADAFPDLDKAEEAFEQGLKGKAGALHEAETVYKGLVKKGMPLWLRVIVQYRLFKIYADSNRAPEALGAFLDLVKAGPRLTEGMKLPPPNPEAHEANKEMLQKVEAALREASGKPYAAELSNFQANLQVLEGTPEQGLERIQPLLSSPDEKIRQSAQLKQIELLLAAGRAGEAGARLAETGDALAAACPADVVYWRGRVYQEQKKFLEAALEFMHLPILYADKDRSRTAEALWRAGQAMEDAQAPREEVVSVYNEAVRKYAGTAGAKNARRELNRLGAAK